MKLTQLTSVFAVVLAMAVSQNARAAVLATVGEQILTDEKIKKELTNLNSEQKKRFNGEVTARKGLVENWVNSEVLLQAAKKAGLDRDEDYKRAFDAFQRQYLSAKYLKTTLDSKVTNAAVEKFFNENKTFFDTTKVCASHIVVTSAEEAKKLYEQAKVKGANFEQLAKKSSMDPTVQENKGNLGCFTREQMVPEFTAAAFTMKKGEIKGPVQTMYGYHVIKVTDIKTGKVPNFAEVEAKAKETLGFKLQSELLNDLRTKSNVKVNEEEIKKLSI
jgi:peptidyl-prolyl cis-trans isomerase C